MYKQIVLTRMIIASKEKGIIYVSWILSHTKTCFHLQTSFYSLSPLIYSNCIISKKGKATSQTPSPIYEAKVMPVGTFTAALAAVPGGT